MATIAEIRSQYPQYNDMSDQQLADAMYKAHYSDMPRDQFDSKIGLAPKVEGQPSLLDRVAASPIGRFLHDNIAVPVQGALATGLGIDTALYSGQLPTTELASTIANAVNQQGDKSYQNALARNRNTPGYAAARADAEKQIALMPQGMTDQFTAPFNPSIAGLSALALSGGNLDAANAAADAREAAQRAYATKHPLRSMAANVAGSLLMAPEQAPLPAMTAPNPNLRPGALDAHEAGYVLPPSMASTDPGTVAGGLAGWSGKIKTAQAASEANQQVTNRLAAMDVGIDPEAGITEQGLKSLRATAGGAKTAVIKALPVVSQDAEFADALGQINDKTASLAKSFPNITKNSDIEDLVGDLSNATQFKTEDGLNLVRQLRRDATANFRASADPKKLALAQAQRDAADAVDDLIERNLAQTGQEGLVANYKAARQTLAKSYDLESATNLATGNVNAHRLAALMARGRPLSGGMETIANAASAFPKALQPLDRIGGVEPLSTLDLGAAALSAARGNYGVGAALLGKPVARSIVLSPTMQQSIMRGAGAPAIQAPNLTARSQVPLGAIPYAMSLPMLLQPQRQ